jgi:hypothetical protein
VPYVAGGSNSTQFKKRLSIPLSEQEAGIQGFRRKTPRPLRSSKMGLTEFGFKFKNGIYIR